MLIRYYKLNIDLNTSKTPEGCKRPKEAVAEYIHICLDLLIWQIRPKRPPDQIRSRSSRFRNVPISQDLGGIQTSNGYRSITLNQIYQSVPITTSNLDTWIPPRS